MVSLGKDTVLELLSMAFFVILILLLNVLVDSSNLFLGNDFNSALVKSTTKSSSNSSISFKIGLSL